MPPSPFPTSARRDHAGRRGMCGARRLFAGAVVVYFKAKKIAESVSGSRVYVDTDGNGTVDTIYVDTTNDGEYDTEIKIKED